MEQSSKSTRARKSSRRRLSATTTKPYPGFPLTPHPSGRWCKKIRGKLHYFGKLAGPDAALERFNREWPYLKDGRTPPAIDTGGCTVRMLCNAFLTSKKGKLDAGELSPRTWHGYFETCELLTDHFGLDRRVDDLRPADFEPLRAKLAKRYGVVGLRNTVNVCRMVLKFAFDQELIDKPVRFGQSFDFPSKKTLRKARQAQGVRLFGVDEVARVLDAAGVQLKAMTLLGLNAGFGNTDCATLPQSAVDLARGWIDFPRPKTAIERRVPLWPETVEAIKAAIVARPTPKVPADAGLVFLTRTGVRWVRVQPKRKKKVQQNSGEAARAAVVPIDAISQAFAKLLKGLGINSHRNFYTLRHNFETIAGESKDQVAVDSIMGHVDPSMGAVYREKISDARLLAVVDTVREWFKQQG